MGKINKSKSGLSPDIKTINQMRTIERNVEIPHEGPFCDIMWSDPEEIDSWSISNRGAGILFEPQGGCLELKLSETSTTLINCN